MWPPCQPQLVEPCPLHSATSCGPHPPVVPSMRRVLHPERLSRDPQAAPFGRHFLVASYGMNPEAHCEQHALCLADGSMLCPVQPYNALRIALSRHSPHHPRPTGFHLLCKPSDRRICLMSGSSHTWTCNTTTRCSLRCQILVGPLLWLPRRVLPRSSSTLLLHWDVNPPWHMKSQCLALVPAFLFDVPSAACTRLPPSACVLASLHLPAWSSVHSWLLRPRFGSVSAPAMFPAPTHVLHTSASVRRGAVADARLGRA